MQFWYDGVKIDDLGDVTISQTREYEGGDNPQRAKVTLKLGLLTFARTYADNYALLQSFVAALRKQQAVLRWRNEANNTDYVNRTVTLGSAELPEEWGSYEQALNVTVFFYEHDLECQNLPATFQRADGQTLTFSNVLKLSEAVSVERFSKLRAHRSVSGAKIQVSGLILGDTTVALLARRTALQAEAVKFRTLLNSAEGQLTVGSSATSGAPVFDRAVRVEEFNYEIDQLTNAIAFSFTASYTLFPNEADYASVEFAVEQRDGQTGEQFLSLSGKISAHTETAAGIKLTALVTAVLAEYKYDTASQQQRLDTTANRVSANADGETFTELGFTGEWRRWKADNREMTYLKTGADSGGKPVSFGHVRTFNFRYAANRFNEMRSQRQRAGGVLEASGTWSADPAGTQAQRRAELDAAYQALLTEVNSPDGTLTFAALPGGSQVVRIESFHAELNQSVTGVDWTMSCGFSLFPNEGGYATAEFTVETREALEEGEDLLTLSGRIQATDKDTAIGKLAALRATVPAMYGFTAANLIRPQASFNSVSANGDRTAGLSTEEADGTTFLELTFSEEYRKRKTNLVSWTLQRVDRADAATQLVLTTFSGTVTAGGADADAAYTVALAKAAGLGSGKESTIGNRAFQRTAQITMERRQVKQDLTTPANNSPEEFVRLTFAYEYQSKLAAGRAYLEYTVQSVQDAFGADSENVSGFVAAADGGTAQTAYLEQVRNAYNGRLVRNESTSISRVKAENFSIAQDLRLDFSFSVHAPKTGRVTFRYGIAVARDYLMNERTITVRGSVFAVNADEAETAAANLLTTLNYGNPVRESSGEDLEHEAGVTDDEVHPGVFIKWDFAATYLARLGGVSGLLEMKVTEEVQYSGTRWVAQPLPFNDDGTGGVTIVQPTGVQEGMRTVRGSVTASTLATAETWAKQQRAFLTGGYPLPERWERDFEFVPRINGVAHAPQKAGDNVKVYRVGFTFAELLPFYPADSTGAPEGVVAPPSPTAPFGDAATLTPDSTTIIGPPVSGAYAVHAIWVDKLNAVFRCTANGNPGTWIQEKAAIVPDTSFTGTIPVNYLITIPGDNWAQFYWDGAAWQAVNLQP